MSNLIGISFLDLKVHDDDGDQRDCFSLFSRNCMTCILGVREQKGCSAREGELGAKGARRAGRGSAPPLTRGTVPQNLRKKSRAGPVRVTRISHPPETASEPCSEEASPRSSQEVKFMSEGQGQPDTRVDTDMPKVWFKQRLRARA